MPPLPAGLATQFLGALVESRFMTVVFAIELVSGILLLTNRYVTLALALLSPIIVNIVLFHLLMEPSGMPMAIIAGVLWLLSARKVWPAFTPLFQQRV
jgi:putative oxidoreductase